MNFTNDDSQMDAEIRSIVYGVTGNEDCGFEGPEKTLNVTFTGAGSLRHVAREGWEATLELARCQILSVMSNAHCDAYVLSESSLFVFDARVILKTCGQTRLLHAIDSIIEHGASQGLKPLAVSYARKNYTFPTRQFSPHATWADERAYLDSRFGSAGKTVLAGPLSDDHWLFYYAELQQDLAPQGKVFEVRMHELAQDRAEMFYNNGTRTGEDVTRDSGLGALLPGASIDEHLFEPCGYSSNSLIGPWYATVHITPEPHCSYASFETNVPLSDYSGLLRAVLDVFRPSTFTVHIVCPGQESPFLSMDSKVRGYIGTSCTSSSLATALEVRAWNFVAVTDDQRRARRLARSFDRIKISDIDEGAVASDDGTECVDVTPALVEDSASGSTSGVTSPRIDATQEYDMYDNGEFVVNRQDFDLIV